jgi:hypothetical protein
MALQCLDLMIDDIVRIAKDVCIPKGTVVSIRGIDANNRFIEKHLVGSVSCLPINDEYGTTCGVWVEYLEPIPLTTEILEKNGWKSMKNGSGDFILTKPMVGNSATITKTINGYEMLHGAFNGLCIHYVHQLQHVLRLCVIKKEIEL